MSQLPYEIQPDRLDVVRLAQVTDSHIFGDPAGSLLGLNTRNSFSVVCERLLKEEWRPDALLTTGDLSQDASPESYQYLADYFKSMSIPTFWLPGNHDNPELMDLYLNNQIVLSDKLILLGGWLVIMLDSSVKGKVHGEISDSQLAFLEASLKQYSDKHCLVCLHHQPIDVKSEWLDRIGLANEVKLRNIVDSHVNVKGVLWGHVHQEFSREINGVRWLASPSSCVQFKPGSKDFCAGVESPGYRYLNLHADGRIETVVHRIDNIKFTVDYSIKGY